LNSTVLLVIPPFTQLNTPYPSTVYLKGFLNTLNISSYQADLGIEIILELFSKRGLQSVFDQIKKKKPPLSENAKRILSLENSYINKVGSIIAFLQNKKPALANIITNRNYLPKASRFSQIEELDWAFGTMGIQDKAKHVATLFLEDLGDLIAETIDPNFGFSRYAEHLGRYAYEFDEIETELNKSETYIDAILLRLLEKKILDYQPDLLAISVPFPGNLYSAFKCAQWLKKHRPKIKIALGGGFANTELRSLSEKKVFGYLDYVSLDDGELPIKCIIEHIQGKGEIHNLKRTFIFEQNQVKYIDACAEKDFLQTNVGIPDYSDLLLDKYLSVIEIVNPMHRLWSDGRWNKMTLAHGCYWAKCSFCDTTLDYIKRYEPLKASLIVDKIEKILDRTGENGFHFVDEAAPPSLLRELALELIRRKIIIAWWTNIRFEKNFSLDLCRLLAASGCMAVSGGLEVASDRLLKLINKGVNIEQVTVAANNLTQAGIMVHAYLMYGFPTQTDQETIDSLEVVRQIFESGIVKSGFWHRFALTIHSHIAKNPKSYNIKIKTNVPGKFAQNDIEYTEQKPYNHENFAEGLRVSLFNYMQDLAFELPLQEWFPFKIPKTSIPSDLINNILLNRQSRILNNNNKLVWLGSTPETVNFTKMKKNRPVEMSALKFTDNSNQYAIKLEKPLAIWLISFLAKISVYSQKIYTVGQMERDYYENHLENFQLFLHGKNMDILRQNELLIL
jgi:radical SAM superfamily enzyme YgiQ (UPF0313 family)